MEIIKDRIARKALEMFFRYGIKKVKMDNIAQSLNISKRTIYENYRNKDTLIRAAIDLSQKEYTDFSSAAISQYDNIIDAVLGHLKFGSELLASINPKYYDDLKRLYPVIWKEKIEESKVQSYKTILELLKKGKDQGIYRPDINEEIIAIIMTGQIYMLSDRIIFPRNRFSIVEVYENIVISMTRGVATSKGLALLDEHLTRD